MWFGNVNEKVVVQLGPNKEWVRETSAKDSRQQMTGCSSSSVTNVVVVDDTQQMASMSVVNE